MNTTFEIETKTSLISNINRTSETLNRTHQSISCTDQMFQLDKHLNTLNGHIISVKTSINDKGQKVKLIRIKKEKK